MSKMELTPVEPAAPLKVEGTSEERQFSIEGRAEGRTWEERYVNFSGYFGNYGPHVFAAAPDLLEALQECEDYFDQRADAEYFPDSALPKTNEEMDMLTMIRDVLGKAGQ